MVSLRILKWVRWQKEEGVETRSCGEVKSKSQKEVRGEEQESVGGEEQESGDGQGARAQRPKRA
jgi:hypothetical protein